ncbi:hypothetical protein GCM10023189_36430 [Nibrella saemangeumensis]|uniref:2-oxoisovalerate dehydrogenase E1 subunit beta n=1 Tax=Nibrella saemangeumensis TaxID=1084526 RepID=A0ABP8N7B6_9BACT
MKELAFTIEPDKNGGYVAKSRLENGTIITQGDTFEELKAMIADAIDGYYFDNPAEKPQSIQLKY